MKKIIDNNNVILVADEGKFLFNGEVYVISAQLGKNDSEENWNQVDTIPLQEDEE